MNIIPSLILSFILVGLWSCSDIGDPVSCTQEIDCTGICGGGAIVDDCGICGGNNLSCKYYLDEIQPIFNISCISCHDGYHESGLELTSYSATINGLVIIPGDHTNSKLWQYVDSGYMPMGGGADLSTVQVTKIASWIDDEEH